ncbi:MAG: DUF934 domain-containing protein [Gallionella sp.]|nr:DUF934 domain-containing protein [Gallionella sp.]
MFKLIKNNRSVTDTWKTLTLAARDTPHSVRLPAGPLLVPLSVWQARRAELIHREYEHGWPLGIWLTAAESAEAIAHDIDDFTVIAIELGKFTGGDGHATARLLRERHGYQSELRAIGDVTNDQLTQLRKAGFDTFIVSNYTNTPAETVPSGWFNFNVIERFRSLLHRDAIAG